MIFTLPEGKSCAAYFEDNNNLPAWVQAYLR